MFVPNLYNHEQLASYLKRQQEFAWDLEKDFPWDKGINLNTSFVPVQAQDFHLPFADANDLRVLSQYVGLLINSTICEMEKALDRSRKQCWENIMDRFPTNPEMEKLGEEFFIEEYKHSLAFDKYLDIFAQQTNVTREELKDVLPIFDHSKIEKLIRFNGIAGGMAMWWVVAAVEEESIAVYQSLVPHKNNTDPLFYEVHKKHFLEESRHAGYAFLMLDLYRTRASSEMANLFKKTDFLISEILQISWIMGELLKSRKIQKLRSRHPFYEHLARLLPVITSESPWRLIARLFNKTPYISLILNPQRNRHLVKTVNEFGAWKLPHSVNILDHQIGVDGTVDAKEEVA
jgi:hypothetical protein